MRCSTNLARRSRCWARSFEQLLLRRTVLPVRPPALRKRGKEQLFFAGAIVAPYSSGSATKRMQVGCLCRIQRGSGLDLSSRTRQRDRAANNDSNSKCTSQPLLHAQLISKRRSDKMLQARSLLQARCATLRADGLDSCETVAAKRRAYRHCSHFSLQPLT